MSKRQRGCIDWSMIIVWTVIAVFIVVGVKWMSGNCSETYFSPSNEIVSRCPLSYRIYDDTNIDLPAGRDRCRTVCNYDFSQYEYYCPHNCRQYGVSLCDQGSMM